MTHMMQQRFHTFSFLYIYSRMTSLAPVFQWDPCAYTSENKPFYYNCSNDFFSDLYSERTYFRRIIIKRNFVFKNEQIVLLYLCNKTQEPCLYPVTLYKHMHGRSQRTREKRREERGDIPSVDVTYKRYGYFVSYCFYETVLHPI